MKKIFILLSPLFLCGCLLATIFPNDYYKCASLSGWCKYKPPSQSVINNTWKYKHKEFERLYDYMLFKKEDMRSCGIDSITEKTIDIKKYLCFENRGWYLIGGPICEKNTYWYEDVCIKWRSKHSKPNAKPWG